MIKMNNIKIHNSAYVMLKEVTKANHRSLVNTIDILVKKEYQRIKKNDKTRAQKEKSH